MQTCNVLWSYLSASTQTLPNFPLQHPPSFKSFFLNNPPSLIMPFIYSLAWDCPLAHVQPTLTTFLKNTGCWSPSSRSLSVAPQLGVEAHVPSSIQAGMLTGLLLCRSCVGSHSSWESTLLCPEETVLHYSFLTIALTVISPCLPWYFLCFGRRSCNTDVSFMAEYPTRHLSALRSVVSLCMFHSTEMFLWLALKAVSISGYRNI